MRVQCTAQIRRFFYLFYYRDPQVSLYKYLCIHTIHLFSMFLSCLVACDCSDFIFAGSKRAVAADIRVADKMYMVCLQ